MANILIVDDSIVMRKNLETIIKQAGHTVIGEASNGKQAVSMYEELRPDVVTMDISMPILSGVDAVKQIIQLDPSANIIMVSAVNQKKMVFNAINSGARHYIVKPIDAKKVISIINEILTEDKQLEAINVIEEREHIQGFQIENEDGIFVIKFNKHLDKKDHKFLEMAVKGIMFIKPLKVVMDFTDVTNTSPGLLLPIMNLSQEIESIDGQVTYKTNNPAIEAIIQQK
jgi:YesN/AraC family two-component response regulator